MSRPPRRCPGSDRLDAHTSSFRRVYGRIGADFHPDIPVVFSRFDVVYSEP